MQRGRAAKAGDARIEGGAKGRPASRHSALGVLDRRGDKLTSPDTEELFEGDIWTGSQALSLGLVDGLGDMRPTMRDVHGEKVKFRTISAKNNPIKRLLGSSEDRARQQVVSALSVVEEWAAWNRFGM